MKEDIAAATAIIQKVDEMKAKFLENKTKIIEEEEPEDIEQVEPEAEEKVEPEYEEQEQIEALQSTVAEIIDVLNNGGITNYPSNSDPTGRSTQISKTGLSQFK